MINLQVVAEELCTMWEKEGYMSIGELKGFVQQHKLEYIGKGRSRLACKLDDKRVVKFALGSFGQDCNKKEVKYYNRLSDKEKNSYVHIYDCGKDYQYLLVEKVVPNIDENEKEVPAHMKMLIHDSCSFNYGRRYDGKGRWGYKWVVLDYAE
jgi:hypothetical protein